MRNRKIYQSFLCYSLVAVQVLTTSEIALAQAKKSGTQVRSNVAAGQPQVVKYDMVSSQGSCLPDVTQEQANKLMSELNVTTPGATSEERLALGKALSAIRNLQGQPMPHLRGMRMEFRNRKGTSRQVSTNPPIIHICRVSGEEIANVGHMTHEMGHQLGNYQNRRLYNAYNRAVQPGCGVSGYANNRARGRNEEFAETFAAFVTNPSLLESAGGSCSQALSFFRKAFPNGSTHSCGGRVAIADSPSSASAPALGPSDTTAAAATATRGAKASGGSFSWGPALAIGGGLLLERRLVDKNASKKEENASACRSPCADAFTHPANGPGAAIGAPYTPTGVN